MKQLTIELADDVYSYIELRAAIDDERLKEAVERFLTELVTAKLKKRPVLRFTDAEKSC